MKYEHIIFDVDGTLINTEQAVLCSLQKTIKQIKNEEIDLPDLKFALGITGCDALLKLGLSHDTENTIRLWNENMKDYFHTIHVFDEIKEVLHALKEKSYKLGIITSKSKEEYVTDFLPFGLSDYFHVVICADDTTEHKPNPAPMYKYLKTACINVDQALYIGDSIYDMQCAFKAGVDFGLAVWGCASKSPIQATYYFNNPLEILASEHENSRFSLTGKRV